MQLKRIIYVDGGEDDKDVSLEKSYTQFKHDEGEKKTYLTHCNQPFGV